MPLAVKSIVFLVGILFLLEPNWSIAADPAQACSLHDRRDMAKKNEYLGIVELNISGGSQNDGSPVFGWQCELNNSNEFIEADFHLDLSMPLGEKAPLVFDNIKIVRNKTYRTTSVAVDFTPLCAPKCPKNYDAGQFTGRYDIFFEPQKK